MIIAIHHIALLISSENCLEFYKKLGFVETFRKTRKFDTIVLLEGYGIQLEVFIDARHPNLSSGVDEPLGTRHFSLKVNSLEETLKSLMVEHTEIGLDWQNIRYCYIMDPDGNQVELHE